jgi:hypothetical protein
MGVGRWQADVARYKLGGSTEEHGKEMESLKFKKKICGYLQPPV